MEFFMAMIPPTVTAQEQKTGIRNGKPFRYEPENLKTARSSLKAHLAKHKPEKPFSANIPLELHVIWCFPTSHSDRIGKYKTTKPDTDNLDKLLKDCMTQVGFWNDDAQVCREVIEKFWGSPTGIYIRVEELSDPEET